MQAMNNSLPDMGFPLIFLNTAWKLIKALRSKSMTFTRAAGPNRWFIPEPLSGTVME